MALNKKKKVIIAIAALAVVGGIGTAIGNTTTEGETAPVASAPAATTESPDPVPESPAPVTESPAPAEEAAPVQVADNADPADIETVLSGFPGDGAGYTVLDSAATDHAEGTVVGLEVETPLGTTERGVWILFTNGSVQAANAETVEGASASWPVRKDARYAMDDEVISVDMSLGAN